MVCILGFTTWEIGSLCFVTGYVLQDLYIEHEHLKTICIGMLMSNLCIFTVTGQYVCFLMFLRTRFYHINSILKQLLFEETLQKHSVMVTKLGMRIDDAGDTDEINRFQNPSVPEAVPSVTIKMEKREINQDAFSVNRKNIWELFNKT